MHRIFGLTRKRGYRFGNSFDLETLLFFMIAHNIIFPPFDFL